MAWTKMKTVIVAGVVVLLAAGTTTIAVKEYQEHRTYPWQVQNADFGLFYKMPPQVKIIPTKFSKDGVAFADGGRGAMGIAQPLKKIVQYAYQKYDLYTVVNTDLPTNRYDFIAKLVPAQEPHKNIPSDENWTIELQKEITRKFGIKGSLEMRDADVMVLKPSSAGIRGFKVSHEMPNGHAVRAFPGNYSFHEQSITSLTSLLENNFKIPVVDQTGLTNEYDFALKWTEPNYKQPNLQGMKQALLDQLGLELVPTNMPIEMLVVEKAR